MIIRRDLVVGALAAASMGSTANASPATTPGATESPFVCDRLALTPALRHRHFDELGPWLRTKVTAVRPLSDAYEFRFASDWQTFSNLTEWMNGERVCCPFFDIDLRVNREHGEMWLRLSGRPGTVDFIRSDFQLWGA